MYIISKIAALLNIKKTIVGYEIELCQALKPLA